MNIYKNFQDSQARIRAVIIAEEQQLNPMVGTHVQELALVHELSMNGLNGSPLQVEHAEDRLGPSKEAPNRIFYVYALVLHWHASPAPDKSACRAIK